MYALINVCIKFMHLYAIDQFMQIIQHAIDKRYGVYNLQDKCSNVFNAACGIRCHPGYRMVGSSVRLCQENGQWSGTDTKCVGE